jgi:hypothetical protein
MDNTDFNKIQDSNLEATQEPVVPTPVPVAPELISVAQLTMPTPMVSPAPIEPSIQPEASVVPPPTPVSNPDSSKIV